ncbi:MAG TPA: ABC transporter substrate-binding protein [Gemmatimonadaceae bacterium]|nr:ABC transporter substrate-binding protein [Gemmatimonadaceae bacterium]
MTFTRGKPVRYHEFGRPAAILGLVAVFGCVGDSASRGGTLVVSSAGDADVLFPPLTALAQSHEVTDLVFEKLAAIGPDLNTMSDAGWTPRLAQSWSWSRDSMSVTFHLNPRATWHDGTPVRANDVRFAFDLYTDPKVHSSDGRDIAEVTDSVSVSDSLTCTAWFKRAAPERFYTLVGGLVPLPEHILSKVPRDSLLQSPFAHAPVGSGPYKFVKWEPKQRIEIAAADRFYLGQPRVTRVIWTIAPELKTAVQRVFTGEADFIETLTPAEASAPHDGVRPVRLRGNVLGYAVFNMHEDGTNAPHPLFGDRALRRALSMALDRKTLAANIVDTSGRVPYGPFSRSLWSADSTLRQAPFDVDAARRALDSLGWRMGKDSVRYKNGKPLAFSIVTPSSSEIRNRTAVVMQEQWRQVGAKVTAEVLDFTAMGERMRAKKFDIVIMQTFAAPSPSGVRQAWSTSSIGMGGANNPGRYSNPVVDSAIDNALTAPTVTAARAHYRVAYQALLDDAPGIWLWEPAVTAGASTRLDLATLRPDAWWTSIPTWGVTGSAPRGAEAAAKKQ